MENDFENMSIDELIEKELELRNKKMEITEKCETGELTESEANNLFAKTNVLWCRCYKALEKAKCDKYDKILEDCKSNAIDTTPIPPTVQLFDSIATTVGSPTIMETLSSIEEKVKLRKPRNYPKPKEHNPENVSLPRSKRKIWREQKRKELKGYL